MNYETLSLTRDGGIARITLNRVAMNMVVMQELLSAALICDEDPEVRAVIICSSNKLFSAGGDLAWFAQSGDNISARLKEATVYLHGAISRFTHMNKPVITAVNGVAAGAGMSLAIMSDFVIASESASFTAAYTAAGLSPDASSTYFLPRLIGERRAKELMITNRKLSAPEALDWGLINQVVPDGEELAAAETLAKTLAKGPTQAFSSVKHLINRSSTESLETQMSLEAEMIGANAAGIDGQEGINAFLTKRKPVFKGQR